jgi:hypothetical protein
MTGNEQRQQRLRELAESAWETATQRLTAAAPPLTWRPAKNGSELSRSGPAAPLAGFETRILYRRADSASPYVSIEATARHSGNNAQTGRVSQSVRLLSVLSPRAELAPPLIVNGCLAPASNGDIRPVDSDRDTAGDAVWHFGGTPCLATPLMDLHGGRLVDEPPVEDFWDSLFSVSREDYGRLAADDLGLAAAQRRYWLADSPGDGTPVWRQSLGSTENPVVLVFPAVSGCPRFAAGVHIVGVVFVDAPCPEPMGDAGLEIIGSLVVNGDLNPGATRLRLQHIQVADPGQTRLALPVLRVVRIPGSWRDF